MNAKPKICLDISQIVYVGGVPTYTKQLAKHLNNSDQVNMEYFYSSLRQPLPIDLKNTKQYKIPPRILEFIFNTLRLSVDNFIDKVDIFHSSDWIQPKTKAKKVTTYHDVVPLKYPEWSHPRIIKAHQKRLEYVEKEIDMVIAVSEATKKDLLELTKIPAEKIRVIYEGVGDYFKPFPKEEVEEFRVKYNLPSKFILAIGGVGDRRNLARVREAAGSYDLYITGQNLPTFNDDEMPLLYNAATLLLYPSFYEGFGLPILEAMACGTPVITSNVSSLPEVSGEAAILVDPTDIKSLKKEVTQVMEDIELGKVLAKKGITQAKKFSWERCAEETVKVYKEVLR